MTRRSLAHLIVLLCFLIPATASAFSQLIVFGDSLSDNGNLFAITPTIPIPPSPPYFQGRVSNGPVWAEYAADDLNLSLDDRAFAGATSGFDNTNDVLPIGLPHPDGPFPGLLDQIDAFAAENASGADSEALYVVWAGANDFLALATNPALDPNVVIATGITNIATAVGTLATLGARDIVVFNLPDLGLTPLAASFGPQVQEDLSNGSFAFNTGLRQTLESLGLNVRIVDVFTLLREVVADTLAGGSVFGFTNATDPCLVLAGTTVVSLCPNPDEYISWDGFHGTTATYRIAADQFLATLAAPTGPQISGGSGGCSLSTSNQSPGFDPTLVVLLAAATIYLARGRGRTAEEKMKKRYS